MTDFWNFCHYTGLFRNSPYDEATNTDDLSEVSFSLSYIAGDFGELKMASKPQSADYIQCVANSPDVPVRDAFSSDAEFQNAINEFAQHDKQCWANHEIDKLLTTDTRSYAYSIDFHTAVEGNQNFSSKNTVFGVQGLFSMSDYPSLRIDLERIDASENETRTAITTEDEYDRISAEIGYRYRLNSSSEYPVTFYLSYRYFHELSAPVAIKAAEFDSFDYTAVALRLPARMFGIVETDDFNLFVRYTDGQLPFDSGPDQALQLGFSSDIGVLGRLLE